MLLASGQKNCDKLVIINKHLVGSTELTRLSLPFIRLSFVILFCSSSSIVHSFPLLGSAPTGPGTITLDPTFESFTLTEPVSH